MSLFITLTNIALNAVSAIMGNPDKVPDPSPTKPYDVRRRDKLRNKLGRTKCIDTKRGISSEIRKLNHQITRYDKQIWPEKFR